jgi:catechol 2,3-dioxygenase-like lactoylglutathione lyase family enzyme
MSIRWQCIGIDTPDPSELARWWAELLGWRITYEDGEEVVLEPQAGSPEAGVVPDISFFKVDDPKVAKNRLHFDLRPDDRDAEVARAEALGATRVDIGQGDQTWVVLADPEGNEFCILRAFTPEEQAEADGEAVA